ncbi:uncharacterized protein LOC126655447 [Mercurialis annua]|uniref:uncharacterized protein LOC126655447 n=1 Tax=Mercurialis annua TaxID=3986 RepID=UPI0024AE6FD4|nr:uncharacterized protein LOC126655447 [Mercurialis annua]
MGSQCQASSTVIANIIKHKFIDVKTIYTPNDIRRDMKNDYSVDMDYWRAWRCRGKAIDLIRGTPKESFAQLPSYLHMVKTTNPGSYVKLETDEDSAFLYAFMALNASIKGWKHCMPIVVVDGTFLKGPYGGTLLAASTHDSAGKIFPLAYAVTDSENNNSWNWFFESMMEVYGVREGMCIISDRHESIKNAITDVYGEEVKHGVCIFHLLNNLKVKFRRKQKEIKDIFLAAAKAYTETEFNYQIAEMDALDSRVKPYLEDVGYEKWALSKSVHNRFNIMTSNTAESLNAAINKARELPVSMLFEYLRSLTQRWSYKNRHLARCTITTLMPKHEESLRESFINCIKLEVEQTSDEIFKVSNGDKTNTVNIMERTCTCKRFQLDMIPCIHALAVFNDRHQDPYKYCSKYYTKNEMLAAYEDIVYPIANEESWDIPIEIKNQVVLTPKGKVKAGRPRKQRIKGPTEKSNKNRCGRCEKYGHNKKTCRNPPKN